MALLWLDGFDSYNDSSSFQSLGYTAPSGIDGLTISTSFKRTQGKGLSVSSSRSFNRRFLESSTVIIGIAWYHTSYVTDGVMISIKEHDINDHHLSLRYAAGSRYLQVLRGNPQNGTVLATSTYSLPLNTWIYIEFKGKIDDTTGSFELRVNGTNILSGSNLDTRNNTTPGAGVASAVNIGRSDVNSNWGSGNFYVDDFYICNNQGTANNDFLGDCTVVQLPPDGPGDLAEFDAYQGENWEMVKEINGHDGNTSYVSAATSGKKDLYNVEPLEFTASSIKGLAVQTTYRKDKNSFAQIRNLLKSDSTLVSGDSETASTTFLTATTVIEKDPATNQLWTNEGLANVQIGVERVI